MSDAKLTLSRRKKVCFASVIFLVIWGAAEAFLLLVGAGENALSDDPFVGFDSNNPVFIENTSGDSGWLETSPAKTVWFNPQRFQRKKPLNTKRVFCLGGSTTFGRPFDDRTSFSGWLKEMLPRIDGDVQWEIINAGGVSYASYRVANVMEELCGYEPDLFVVLTGHNEFLEQRTYRGLLDDAWTEEKVVAGVRRFLQHSRVFSVFEEVLRPKSDLMRNTQEILPAEVDEILNHSAGPKAYTRDDPWHENVLIHFQVNIERMIAMARRADADLVFLSPTANLKDCLPFKSFSSLASVDSDSIENPFMGNQEGASTVDSTEEFSRMELQRLLDNGGPEVALNRIDEALRGDPRNADLLFFKGRCLLLLDREGEAREYFWQALDEDVCPLRMPRAFRAGLREITSRESIPLIDLDQILGNQSEIELGHRCLGEEYFLDHVHPTIDAHRSIAVAILTELQDLGWLKGGVIPEQELGEITDRIKSSIDRERQAIAFRNLAKVLHWAGKFEEAIPNAINATQLVPDDLESWFVMGDCLRQLGRDQESYLVYEQLFQKGDYGRAYLPFGELLMDMEKFDRAIEFLFMATIVPKESHRVRAFYNLGYSHLQLGEVDSALESLTECDRLAPDEPSTNALLGDVYFSKKELELSEARFLKTLELGGDPTYCFLRLAQICLETERWEEARDYLQRCRKSGSQTEAIQEWIRRLEEQLSAQNTGK